jgi:hypothetical protein
MDQPRTEQSARRLASWFDLEGLLYALVGIVVVVEGGRALASWVVTSWVEGKRFLASLIVSLVLAAAIGFLFFVRRRKRLLYLGIGLVAVGFVTFGLASAGFTLPPSWLQ